MTLKSLLHVQMTEVFPVTPAAAQALLQAMRQASHPKILQMIKKIKVCRFSLFGFRCLPIFRGCVHIIHGIGTSFTTKINFWVIIAFESRGIIGHKDNCHDSKEEGPAESDILEGLHFCWDDVLTWRRSNDSWLETCWKVSFYTKLCLFLILIEKGIIKTSWSKKLFTLKIWSL